jgi:hypothetical protein
LQGLKAQAVNVDGPVDWRSSMRRNISGIVRLVSMQMRLLCFASVAFAGCAFLSPGPKISEMQTDSRCHAWLDNGSGYASARVEGERAILYGGMADAAGASFASPDGSTILFGETEVASYSGRTLMMRGAEYPIRIAESSAIIRTSGGDAVVQFNRACGDRDAALGTASLFVATSRRHHR